MNGSGCQCGSVHAGGYGKKAIRWVGSLHVLQFAPHHAHPHLGARTCGACTFNAGDACFFRLTEAVADNACAKLAAAPVGHIAGPSSA